MEKKPNINRFDINTKRNRRIENTMGGKLLHKSSLVLQIVITLFLSFCGILLMLAAFRFDEPGIKEPTYQLMDDVICLSLSILIYYFILKSKIPNFLVRCVTIVVIYFVITYFIYDFSILSVTVLQIITGLFGLITSVVLFLNVIRQIKDHVSFLRSLIWGIIYGFTGIDLLLGYKESSDFTIILGFYLFTFAFNLFWRSLKSLFALSSNSKEVKRKTITLPTVVSAFLPIGFFNNLNSTVNRDDYEDNLFIDDEEVKPDEEKADLTIYVHTRAGLMPGFGHVDISLDDKVYCYGNYDDSTWILGGFLSDGVLATTTPENHIQNALTNDKKVLVAYDLKISEETKEKIQKQIDKMMSKAYRWRPNAELAALGEIEGKPEDYDDVASLMYRREDTELYKFEKGSPYKTYYLLGQNCAMVANEIVGQSGIHLSRLNRIVTPGAYLEYLDQLYKMKHTIVVNRSIYMLNDNGKPYLLSNEPVPEANVQEA